MLVNAQPLVVDPTRVVAAVLDLSGLLAPSTTSALLQACDSAEDAEGCQILVLRLTGTEAAAPEWPGGSTVHPVGKWEKALRRLERLRRFTVSVCEGPCSQAALEVLLATDYRIGGPGTALTGPSSPEGVWPGMAVHRLVRQVGPATARRLVLLREDLTARRLVEAGILDEITDNGDAAVDAAVRRAADYSGSETAVRRQLLADAGHDSYEEALGAHLAAADRTLRRRLVADGEAV